MSEDEQRRLRALLKQLFDAGAQAGRDNSGFAGLAEFEKLRRITVDQYYELVVEVEVAVGTPDE